MRADLKEWMLKTSEELQGLGSKVLLWTNPSPTAAFGAQTVISNTDLTIYDEIEIYYAGNTGYPDCVHVVKQPANTNSYIFGSSNSLTARNVVITGNSLSFGKGIRYAYAGNGADDNAQLIPQKIYGVIIGATGGGGSGGGTSDYEDLENKPTINGVTLVEGLVTEDLNLGDTAHEEISQADFDALTSEEQNDGTVYFITDGVASNVFVDDNVPVGTIAPYGGSNDPAYWLICDGRAVSRTAYADLFTVIGTTYGTGDGSTTFNIPDLRGNVAMGASDDYDLGDIGGKSELKLSATIGAANSNSVSLGYITDGYTSYQGSHGATYVIAGSGISFSGWNHSTPVVEHNVNSRNVTNLQPYVVTNYIIKASSALSENQSQLDFFYPVGSCYETSNLTFNPNIRWGGTWELLSDSYKVIGGMERFDVSGSGGLTVKGQWGDFPTLTEDGTYRLEIECSSTTASYTITAQFNGITVGNASTTNGSLHSFIEDINGSDGKSFSLSITTVAGSTHIKVTVYKKDNSNHWHRLV